VSNLDLHQLTRAVTDWAQLLPGDQRHAMLLKLSTATALAATASATSLQEGHPHPVGASALAGRWTSAYRYHSTSRGAELEDAHTVDLRCENGKLIGRSLPHPERSVLELDLTVNGTIASGTWVERTSPMGHYRAATYHGLIQLVADPTGRQMTGRWLGVGKRFEVKSGVWQLTWAAQPDPSGPGPVTTATTVEPTGKAPSAMSENTPSISFPT
jgi:hypothetical protein